MHRITVSVVAVVCLLAAPSAARAGSILFEGSGWGDSVGLSAAALFEISGSTLKVTLRNTGDTSGNGWDKSANTLTGVFFDLPSGITLSPTSARIAAGDLLQGNKCDIGPCTSSTTNVGGEFTYEGGSSWSGHNGNNGISSSGYIDAYQGGGNFNGPNLDSPDSPDGINFGIVAPITGSNPFNPKTGNMTANPLIEGEVVFTMAISGGSLLETQISNVSFQYGTSIGEPHFKSKKTTVVTPPPIPEPSALLLLGPGLAAMAVARLRRRRKTAREPRTTT